MFHSGKQNRVRQNGRNRAGLVVLPMFWMMAFCCGVPVESQEPQGPHKELERLEWIVGDWSDKSSETEMHISGRWSDDQNFLLLEYRIQREGAPDRTASERIGWDAGESVFRSWTFRSDGSFGESTWKANDRGWESISRGVLPDGKTMNSAIQWELNDDGQLSLRATKVRVDDQDLGDTAFTLNRQVASSSGENRSGSILPGNRSTGELAPGNLEPGTPPTPPMVHPIEKKTWRLYVLKSVPVEFDRPFTLRLDGGDVDAVGGVNKIGGRYALSENSLTFRYLKSTNNEGPPEYLQLEEIYLEALKSVDSIQHQGTELQLMSGEETVAQFREGR